MVPYYGDYAANATVYIPINTFDSNDPAASVTVTNLLNTDVHIHKDGGTTQRNNAAGITMTINYDSITGNHLLIIDTSDNTVADFFQAGHEYQVRVEGITVDGGTINAWVGSFSIERSGGALALIKSATYGLSALKTLLDTTGIKVASFANNAITAAAINGDAITADKIADNAFANEHFANGALTSTEITSAAGCVVASIANNAITAAAINDGAIDAATFAAGAINAAAIADNAIDFATFAADCKTGTGLKANVESISANAITAASMHTDAGAEIADAVWDEALAGHAGAGTAGATLTAAGSAGDPWATLIPGAYGAGTAGLLLGTTIPAAIDAIDNYVDSEIGALTTELAKVPKSDSNVTWNATALGSIQSECTDALNAYDPPTNAEIPTAAAISDAVWDEASTGHTDAGKAGAQLWTDIDAILTDTGTTLDGSLAIVEDILRNKMEITDANGNLVLYEDDGTTPKYSVSAAITDDSTTTTRKRLA